MGHALAECSPQRTEELMIILAIDLGKFNSMFCVFDAFRQGERVSPVALNWPTIAACRSEFFAP